MLLKYNFQPPQVGGLVLLDPYVTPIMPLKLPSGIPTNPGLLFDPPGGRPGLVAMVAPEAS